MCEEELHNPGELYNIEEEETSEEDELAPSEEENDEDDEDEDDDDEEDSGNITQPTIEEEYPLKYSKENLKNDTSLQVEEMKSRLVVTEVESNKLRRQIEDLQRDVMVKAGGMERLQAELTAAHKESDFVHKKLRKLEEDLDFKKQKNAELVEELDKRTGEMNGSSEYEGFDFNHLLILEDQVKDLTVTIKGLEDQLAKVKKEKDQLESNAMKLAVEREEERHNIEQALSSAFAEKEAIRVKFEKEFERLRTVNTDREQQLLDDFEWKLREVEQACKRRLEEKEKYIQQKIQLAEDKIKSLEEECKNTEKLKAFEAEANQLRGLNLEQQRSLRYAERAKEQLQVSEKVLQEELKKMKVLLDKEKSALTTMQAIHNREIDENERKLRFRLEQQKNELNNQWEEKLKKDTLKLKIELDQTNRDEKRLALESARLEKDYEFQKQKEKWEKKIQLFKNEIDGLRKELEDEEALHKQNLQTLQTNSDRDIFELRRKLDRIDMSYQEQLERRQREHETEIARLVEENERKLQSNDQNWQLQLASTRATLELVKEQLKRETADQLQALHDSYHCKLESQREQLLDERDEIVIAMEEEYKIKSNNIRTEMENAYKCNNTQEQELVDLHKELLKKATLVGDLSTQYETLDKTVLELTQQIKVKDEQIQLIREESEKRLRLEENKNLKLIEDLRKTLSEKESQVAHLSKEKHLYQLELMNHNGHSQNVTARQRRRGSHAKLNKPGMSHAPKK